MRTREPNLQNIPIRIQYVYFDRPDGRYRLATLREVTNAHLGGTYDILFHHIEVEYPPGTGLRVQPCIKVSRNEGRDA
jgi:hypothetical protein